mgnify:CR=1 FL=1
MSQKICIFAPANFNLIMNLFKKQISSTIVSALAISGLMTSCWNDNTSERIITDYNNTLITSISMNANTNVCDNLNSYKFTIDQLGRSDEELIERCNKLWSVDDFSLQPGIIFNPDSLPVGTEADSIKLSISTKSAYKIEFFQYDEELRLKNYTNFKDTQIVINNTLLSSLSTLSISATRATSSRSTYISARPTPSAGNI